MNNSTDKSRQNESDRIEYFFRAKRERSPFLFSVEKLFLSLHPQAPQQSVANEKETSNPGAKIRNLCLFKEWKISKRIAHILGFNKSTLSREIKRNADCRNGLYRSDLAHRKYQNRMRSRPHYQKYDDFLKLQVDILIQADFSPEQVSGYLKKGEMEHVSHETIYLYIWNDKKQGNRQLYKHLRRCGRHNTKCASKTGERGFIKNRIDIDQRPPIVDEKISFGDLEIDTVIGKS